MAEDTLELERIVLGAAMISPDAREALRSLTEDDFVGGQNAEIARAIRALDARGEAADWVTTASEMAARGSRITSAYLQELTTLVPFVGSAWSYACDLRDQTRLRMSAALGSRLADLERKVDSASHLDHLLAEHRVAMDDIPPALDEDADELPTVSDLMRLEFHQRWLIPGLLARRERVVITAAEGGSKSVSLTTWGACLAAGIHPYTAHPLGRTYRILHIDAENDLEQTQHRYAWIGDRINHQRGTVAGWGDRIVHQIRPEGLDIVGKDRTWLTRVVTAACPDLILIGPAYKIAGPIKTSDDAAVLALFAVLDEIRVKHDAALMIEAHSGHAKDEGEQRAVRPFGSSVWLRWPEVGIGLRRNKDLDAGQNHPTYVDVVHWRGTRGTRNWPAELKRGRDHQLPWIPGEGDYAQQVEIDLAEAENAA